MKFMKAINYLFSYFNKYVEFAEMISFFAGTMQLIIPFNVFSVLNDYLFNVITYSDLELPGK